MSARASGPGLINPPYPFPPLYWYFHLSLQSTECTSLLRQLQGGRRGAPALPWISVKLGTLRLEAARPSILPAHPHLLTELHVIMQLAITQPHLFLPLGFIYTTLFLSHDHPTFLSTTWLWKPLVPQVEGGCSSSEKPSACLICYFSSHSLHPPKPPHNLIYPCNHLAIWSS